MERARTYEDSLQVFKAERLREVLARLSRRALDRKEQERHLIYIAVNLAGLISRKAADFLVGEPPQVLGQTDADSWHSWLHRALRKS
mgnify:FL=1